MHSAQPTQSTPVLSAHQSKCIYGALPQVHLDLEERAFVYYEEAFCQWVSAIAETQGGGIATSSETLAKISLALQRNKQCLQRFSHRAFGNAGLRFRTLTLRRERQIVENAMLVEETLDVLAKKYGGLLHTELQHQLRTYEHFRPILIAWIGPNDLFDRLRRQYT